MRRTEPQPSAAWPAVAVLLMAAGCSGSTGPPAIAIGAPCAACGMEVRDLHFACERKVAGAWRVYDAIECLMRDTRGPAGTAPGRGDAWLADYDTGALHPADSVWVVRGAFASPMGGGLAAFRGRAAADSIAAETRGRVARLAAFMADSAGSAP